jgi:Tfp pilus assembly protein PilX
MNRNDRKRRGAVLIVAMVCVAVATAAMISLVRLAMAQRNRLGAEALRLQCAWLAESALERAAWRLAADPKYPGETWNLPADTFGGSDPAAVTIQVEPIPEQPMRRLVRVRADYPDHPEDRVRLSRQAVVELQSTGEKK